MKREKLTLTPLVVDRRAPVPIYLQICRQITQAIRNGELRRGSRLPPTRLLAKLLRVSRNTVLTAYEELKADGLITGQVGAGMAVVDGLLPLGMYALGLRPVIRAANFPVKVISFTDVDGNPLYLNF